VGVGVLAQPVTEVVVALGGAEGGGELVEALCRDLVEERLTVSEMAQRGAVADAGPLGETSDRDRLGPLVAELPSPLGDEDLAEGAMVVGSGHESSLRQCRP
jgi:hypothetical protein